MVINTIKQYINNIFLIPTNSESYSDGLEAYIVSKNPQSTYDVEYLTKQYDYNLAVNRKM